MLVGLTASCGPLSGSSKTNTPSSQPSTQPSSEQLVQQNGALEVPAPIALPPQYGSRPGASNTAQNPTLPNGLPALQPKGMNVDNLFAENISDTDRRFNRLEGAVSDLRREFESFKPSIVRLVAVESDIQDLIKQLDVLLRNEPAPQPSKPMVAAQPPTQLSPADTAEPSAMAKPAAPLPSSSAGSGPMVKDLRIGQHAGKVRLVMDLNQQASFTTDLDNQENILIIELPDARWNAATQKSFGSKSPLLKSYSVEPINNGNGSRVIISLKRSAQIQKTQALPPGPNPNYRIYMDLQL